MKANLASSSLLAFAGAALALTMGVARAANFNPVPLTPLRRTGIGTLHIVRNHVR